MKWHELKSFALTLDAERLQQDVYILEVDEPAKKIDSIYQLEADVWKNKHDSEDCGSLEELKEAYREDFDIEDYELGTEKGFIFLSID